MKRVIQVLPVWLLCFIGISAQAQIVDITVNPGTSGNIPFGTLSYHASEIIYTEAEIGASNFTTAGTAISHVGFALSTLGTNPTFNNVNIYMKDVPLSTTTFTSGTYSTAGYTLVYTGSITFSSASLGGNWTSVALTTPYVRTPGTNLQVMITRTDATSHTGFVWTCSVGNSTSSSAITTRRYNGSAALSPSTTMSLAAFRPAIRLSHKHQYDLKVNAIYSLGKLPYPNGATQPISASISNVGTDSLNNVYAHLAITGANTFVDSQFIASLPPDSTVVINFSTVTYTALGANTLTVSLPTDDDTTNNVKSIPQLLNANTWSYAYGPTPTGGVGFTGNTGNFVAKFNTNALTYISQITVNFTTGGNQYKLGIWDASGTNGTPGTLLWDSPNPLTTVSGVNVLPVSPPVLVNSGDFYVGVRQVGTTNVGFAYQSEVPIRANTFYYSSPITSTTWNDFAPNNPFRFMIEPKLILPIDISLSDIHTNTGSITSCTPFPQQVTALLTNTGANNISIGAATVTLKIRGANTYTSTYNNVKLLSPGDTELVTFSGINLLATGTNFDTMYVTLTGDGEPENDTQKIQQTILPTITTLPVVESYDNPTFNVGNLTQLSGTGNWALQSGSPTTLAISPHSGNTFVMFNCYSFASGVSSRIYSSCITLPSTPTFSCSDNSLGFWITQDNSFSTSLDSVYACVSNDGGMTWTRLFPGFARYNSSYSTPGWKHETVDLSSYAGQTIQVGLEGVSKFGNIIGVDDIMIGSNAMQMLALSTPASNAVNMTASCDDNGWTYYSDPSISNTNFIAINWDPNNTGANTAAKAAASPNLYVDTGAYSVEIPALQMATFVSKRYWNVNLNSTTLTGPVHVRFFYDSTEIAQVTNRANAFIGLYGGTLETPTWFKTVSGAYANDTSHLDAGGVFNAMYLSNKNTNSSRINGLVYAQFDSITSFSGGSYAAGVGLNSPLPISIIDIQVSQVGSKNKLQWTIAHTAIFDHFIIEKSNDGRTFYEVGTVTANQQQTYSYYDSNPLNGSNYYRVKAVNPAGNSTYSKTVSIFNSVSTSVSIFPNPVKDAIHLQIMSAKDMTGDVVITDITGKILYSTTLQLTKGSNQATINMQHHAKGTYFLKFVTAEKTTTHKFDVQ